jgi:hypothetical protein
VQLLLFKYVHQQNQLYVCRKSLITARSDVSFVIHRRLIIACSCCAVAAQGDLIRLIIVTIYFR